MRADIPYSWLVTAQIWKCFQLVELQRNWLSSTNQKNNPNLCSDTSSTWNFCSGSSDIISRETDGGVAKCGCSLRLGQKWRVTILTDTKDCKSRLSLIVWVKVVLNRTVVVDSDWRFDNLCGSHFDSEDDYRTGWRNVSHCQQQQSYSGLPSPRRSNSTYFLNDSWVQTFHIKDCV